MGNPRGVTDPRPVEVMAGPEIERTVVPDVPAREARGDTGEWEAARQGVTVPSSCGRVAVDRRRPEGFGAQEVDPTAVLKARIGSIAYVGSAPGMALLPATASRHS